MSFGENLQFLRKRNAITQEQLAERLAVSRQSVSKWESDGSLPEMDKLVQLCDMFSCDLDTLIRGNAEESTAEDTEQYDAHMNSRSKWMAAGVGLLLFGLGLQPVLDGFGVTDEIGNFFFLACVAVAVVIFIVINMQHDSFRRRNPHIKQFYSEENLCRFEKRYPLLVAVPVGMIILAVAGYVPIEIFLLERGLSEEFSGGIFMCVIAIAVAVLVYGGMQKAKYDIRTYNRENCPEKVDEAAQEKAGKWYGVIMLVATALFLLSIGAASMDYMKAKSAGLSFDWKSSIVAFSWCVFPIGGILCGIVSIIFSKKEHS